MTPEQYRAALVKLELTQVGAAELLGVDGRTSRRYAAGDADIPRPTAKLLRLMLAGKLSVADVERA